MQALTIRHVTTYTYRKPVAFGAHRLMLRPRDGLDQRNVQTKLVITPVPTRITWSQDKYGNHVAMVRFRGKADRLCIESLVTLDHIAENFSVCDLNGQNILPFWYSTAEQKRLKPYLSPIFPQESARISEWVRDFVEREEPGCTKELLSRLCAGIRRGFRYQARHAGGIQSPAETLRLGSGTCRDFAVLMIEAAKSLGLAARFVSGYLHVRGRNGESHVGGCSTHAWAQVCLPGKGWVDFDPTNAILGNDSLVRVAVVQDPFHALPLTGTWHGEAEDFLRMDVDVTVAAAAAASIGPRQRALLRPGRPRLAL